MVEKRNSFDALVMSLTDTERREMLEKMKVSGNGTESLASEDIGGPYEHISFSEQIKKEPVFYRIFLWLVSLFKNTTTEAVYNERKVAQIARGIDDISPNLIDYKRSLFLSSFYDKLSQLKLCADFFRPYIAAAEEDEGAFLVFLGAVVMPDIKASLDAEVDPYSLPLTEGVRLDMRMRLLRKMDDIAASIPLAQRNLMYSSARAVEWLSQFSKLPFMRFIGMFSSVVEGTYTCSFGAVESEVSSFARILCNGMRIPEEAFEALFLFSRKDSSAQSLDSIDDVYAQATEFMEKAKSQIAMMKMFISSAPMRSIGCVVYADADWNPGNFTGGEDWMQRYKAGLKKVFDQKWEAWSNDCKKESLRSSLEKNFGLDTFPLLPYRPWADLWGGFPFRYELTAGFLFWFMKEKFPERELALKAVMLEGDFIQKKNRAEYNDAFNKFIQLSVDMQDMERKLAPGGEYGIIFSKLRDEKIHSLQAHSKIESIIRGIEAEVRSMLSEFGDAARSIEQCISGIFMEKKDSRYDSLSNLSRIQGKDNEKFQSDLEASRESIANCFALIRELEPIDTPGLVRS